MKLNTVRFVDCRKGLKTLSMGEAHHMYTDMPFEIDFNKTENMYNRKKDKVVQGYKEPKDYSDGLSYYEWVKTWLPLSVEKIMAHGSIWLGTGWTHEHEVRRVAEECGLTLKNQIIWKYQFGVWTTRKFVTSHYSLLWYVKDPTNYYFDLECRFGKKQRDLLGNPNYRDREDVWVINRPYKPGKEKNANEQPEELVEKALKYTTQKDDIILDPFMGGGTTAVVCKKLERYFIGFELNKSLKPYIQKRLKNVIK